MGNDYGPCAMCGKNFLRPVFKVLGKDELRCWNCGVFYYWPLPTEKELEKIYTTDWAHGGDHTRKYLESEAEAENIRKHFIPRLSMLAEKGFTGKLLDVGCAAGSFLKLAKERGWDVEGLDLGEAACQRTSQSVGCPVHCGVLETAGLRQGSYDIIHASQVLEHVLQPKAFLAAAHRLLKPGGGLLLATPIIDGRVFFTTASLQKLLFSAAGTGQNANPFAWAIYPPYHVFVHSTRSLFMLLEEQGFRVMHRRKLIWDSWDGTNLRWKAYYCVMDVFVTLLRSGMNIDVLVVKT